MKHEHSIEKFETLAFACKALSHPARIAILRHLSERGSCVCGEVVKVMPLAQATVSQHLKVLKEAGLIIGTVEGPKSCYCVDRQAVARLRDEVERLFGKLGSCC